MRTFAASFAFLSALFIVGEAAAQPLPPMQPPPPGPGPGYGQPPPPGPSYGQPPPQQPAYGPPPGYAAAPPPPGKSVPRIGGHLGIAIPLLTLADPTTHIGPGDKGFVTVGITPGITVKLDDTTSIDFEFIAFNEIKNTPSATTFIVDPGVVHNFGDFSAGLRVATQVGAATNFGIVPIIVKPFQINDQLSYFIEADLPLFIRDTPDPTGGSSIKPSATVLFQSGFAF